MSAAEKQKRYRERIKGVTVTENEESVTENVTGCQHKERVVPTGGRSLTYPSNMGRSIDGTALARVMEGVPEAEMVKCPCCGKEWECKRVDVQSPYCMKCDEEKAEDWRERFPYKRPEMKDKSVLGL